MIKWIIIAALCLVTLWQQIELNQICDRASEVLRREEYLKARIDCLELTIRWKGVKNYGETLPYEEQQLND